MLLDTSDKVVRSVHCGLLQLASMSTEAARRNGAKTRYVSSSIGKDHINSGLYIIGRLVLYFSPVKSCSWKRKVRSHMVSKTEFMTNCAGSNVWLNPRGAPRIVYPQLSRT